MGEYSFHAAKLISKIWCTIAVLFLFAVIMFGVQDEYMTRIVANFSQFGKIVRSQTQ